MANIAISLGVGKCNPQNYTAASPVLPSERWRWSTENRIPILMSLLPVEHLSPCDSLFARFDPRWKLAALVPAAATIAAMRSPAILTAALAIALLLSALARLPGRWFRMRVGALLFALLPFLIILPLTVDHGGPSYQVAGIRLSIDGLVAAVALLCKTTAIFILMLILLASAPLHVTLRAAQRLRVPGLLVMLTMLSYRYLFLLLDELNRLRIALRMRGFRNRTSRHSFRTIGQVTGTLLVRGGERAERVTQAMRCRGFDGRFRALNEFRTSARDVVLFAVVVAAFAGLMAFD
jgi:cobalt/nickel transport system permease protein